MQQSFPLLDKIMMHRFLLNLHCKNTGYKFTEANVNTMVALAMLTEKQKTFATLVDVHSYLHEYENPYTYATVKEHLEKLVSAGFAKKDARDRYAISSKGAKWLTTFDDLIEDATIEKYFPKDL